MEAINNITHNGREGLRISEELIDNKLSELGYSWREVSRGDTPFTLEELELSIICEIPSLWSHFFLREPDFVDFTPYSYFDFQYESIDYDGDVIHSDGAEVGKTREIGNLCLHRAYTTPAGSTLVGAPEQVHLDEIIEYIVEEQINAEGSLLYGDLKHHKKAPHHVLKFKNGHKIYFCPAGHDGRGFRGKHVNALLIMDEAAKIKNDVIWSEFFRAAKPGCQIRIYSVPDGDRNTVYFRLKESAKGTAGVKADGKMGGSNKFKHFNWRKTQQPDPFWSKERKKDYVELFGGEDSPGYKRNVLGEDGDPENPVFAWSYLSSCMKEVPAYRCLKIVMDEEDVSVLGMSYPDDKNEAGEILLEKNMSKKELNLKDILDGFFDDVRGRLIFGCDLGFSSDPSEITVKLVYGKEWRTVARLHLKGVTYDVQADAIDLMDTIYEPERIGVDLGNAGSAVVHNLQSDQYEDDKKFDERVIGYSFGGKMDDINEEGEVIIDPKTEKPRRRRVKEVATDLLIKKVQRGEAVYPKDPDFRNQYSSHTFRETSNGIVYSKGNDHIIDSDRTAILASIECVEGSGGFACGASERVVN